MAAKKKTAKKKTAKKKVAKKAAPKKTKAKKKVAKKKVAKKKTAKKKAAKKKVTKKKTTKKKVAKKKVAKKKTAKPATNKKKSKSMSAVPKKKTIKKKASKKDAQKPIAPYQEKKGEEYMSTEQLEHFKQILLNWKMDLMKEVDRTVHHMKEDASNFADPSDRATQEEEFGLELRTRDRERKLLRKINAALLRVEDGSYGYCEETGEEIGIRRLEARPVATLCLEAQQRRELAKKQYRDREDRDR